tara:strand:+ start:1399 stop:1545 length:147 start_codon:yes stop_codon:yes gene_type:complete
METNFSDGPITVRVEEPIVDIDEYRCNPILITSKNTINDIVVTYFLAR